MYQNADWGKLFLLSALSMTVSIPGLAQEKDNVANNQEVPDAASNWQTSIGIKLHPNKVSGVAGFGVPTGAGLVGTADAINSGTELTPILLGSIRYKNFFVSASHFFDTNYSVKTQLTGLSVDLSRNESDVNVGYYVLPSLSVSVGYKELKFGGGLGDAKYAGPVVGVSGYGSIGSGFGLYGSFAYGDMTFTSTADVPNEAKKHTYLNSEAGLAYSFDFRERAGFLSAITLTLGYRYQNIESKDSVQSQLVVPVAGIPTPLGPPTFVRWSNTSQGPVLGLIVSF
jgi:hypothetical protein